MARPCPQQTAFGPELRRQRLQARLSLAELGAKVHYSPSYLSRLETGERRPSEDVARKLDQALRINGVLQGMLGRPVEPDDGASEGWLSPYDIQASPVAGEISPSVGVVLDAMRQGLVHLRAVGQVSAPAAVQALASEQSGSLTEACAGWTVLERAQALVLASRYAEFAGWMAQEADDDATAFRLTRRAAALAAAANDRELVAYALIRRAVILLCRGRQHARKVIDLARQVRAEASDPWIRGMAVQREAQGYALLGEDGRCRRALDEADALVSAPAGGADAMAAVPLGSSHGTDSTTILRGWCLHELGDPDGAAHALTAGLRQVPGTASRARSRLGARLALSLTGAGDVDQACTVLESVLPLAPLVDSATLRTDLRRVGTDLRRWHNHAAVRLIWPELTAATTGAPVAQ
ncbi:helix-turn-helix domain-containing protein [Symbioplanes lichenis]|uniref:helix-turn-helix domain-containing protein n=1 Tax=Symbioplanes lichenis TaxID=1629072 RepID=UPI0027388C19|nr:helix-turn-helix transcriptional regulator [Actinoplanes lichenis]